MSKVPIEQWGKDHWSVFAYLCTCVMDSKGIIDGRRMRSDGVKYPTLLRYDQENKRFFKMNDHNDYDCLTDLEDEGFIENCGTGLNQRVKMTEKGAKAWSQILLFKQNGGNYCNFVFAG